MLMCNQLAYLSNIIFARVQLAGLPPMFSFRVIYTMHNLSLVLFYGVDSIFRISVWERGFQQIVCHMIMHAANC